MALPSPEGGSRPGSRAHLDLTHATRTQAEWRDGSRAARLRLPSSIPEGYSGSWRRNEPGTAVLGRRASPCAPVPWGPFVPGLPTPWAGWRSATMARAEDFLAGALNAEAATNEGGPHPLPKKGLWCHLFPPGDPSRGEPARLAGPARPRGGQTDRPTGAARAWAWGGGVTQGRERGPGSATRTAGPPR